MANSDTSEWRLLDSDLVTVLGILPASESHLYLVLNEPGAGELKIPLGSVLAGSVESGQFAQCSYRGAVRGGFFIENISKGQADSAEGGGQWVSISGRGALSLLEDAIIWDDGTSASTRDFAGMTKAAILIALIDEAQARGALANLSYDFTAVLDSDGAAWTDSETYKLNVGSSLLDMVRQFARTGIDFDILPGTGAFVLSAYKLGMGSDKSETVYFRTGVNCEEVTSDEHGDKIKNAQLIAYKGGYISVSDAVSIAARRRREKLLDLKMAQTASSATTIGAAEVELSKDPKKSISVKIYDGAGPRGFVDYDLGDYIMLDVQGTETRYRIYGVQPDWKGDQFSTVIVELNSILYENDIQLAQDVDWLMDQWSTANDANLLAVSFWAAIGAQGDTLDKANALHIIGTKLYVAAWFSNEIIGGVVCPTGIAIYDLQTGVWSTPSTAGSFSSDYPTCLTSIGTDLYVGYGSGEHVQKYDTVADTWSSLDGGLYYSVEPDQGTVIAIASDGTNIYATGKFNQAGSPAVTVANIAKFTVATSTWSALGTGINNIGYSLLCNGSNVYAGGAFTSPASRVAVWNGTTWAAMDSGLDFTVHSLVLYGTNILAGGAFTGGIVEWNGSVWTVFGGGVNNTVYALAVYLTDVYVGGAFTDAGKRIARYSSGSWWQLGNGTGASTVYTICLYGDDVYVGGDFSEVGDAKPALRLAVYFNNFESLTNYLENSSSNFNMGGAIHAAAASAITDTDEVPFWEATANALRKITWTNIKATLKTYFDTLYVAITGVEWIDLTDSGYTTLHGHTSVNGVTFDTPLVQARMLATADGTPNEVRTTDLAIFTDVFGLQLGDTQSQGTANVNIQGNTGNASAPNTTTTAILLEEYQSTGNGALYKGTTSRGTKASPTGVMAGQKLASFRGAGYGTTGNVYDQGSTGSIEFIAVENFTDIAKGTSISFWITPVGSVTRALAATIGADGALTLSPASPTNGTDFLKFTTERAWTVQQALTGGSAMLEFFSDTAGKYVRINPNAAAAGGLYIGQYTSAVPEMLHVIGSGNIKAAVESILNTGYAFSRLRNNTPANFDFGLYGSSHGATLYGAVSTNSLAAVSTGAGDILVGTTAAGTLYLGTNGVIRAQIDSSGNIYLGGGTTNAVKIATGGELTLIGTATRWNDLRVEPVVRTTGVKAPTFAAYKTNVFLYDFDNAVLASEKEIYFTVQLPHDWKEGSAIYPHVHWVNRTTGTAGHVVKWAMDYTKAKIGGTFPATSNISGTAIVGGGDITVADEHMITSLTAIAMTGDTISTVLICRLYRNSSDAADTYAGTAGLLYVDFHFEIDSIGGSADEFTK